MKFLIPKFLRKLDKAMLLKTPQLWITKIHYAVPGALVIAISLYLITLLFGYNPKNDIPEQWNSFMLLLLPSVAIFFYWFVIQAQYNVDKNYGRLSIGHDYQNFFSYLIIIFSFFTVLISIPSGQLTNVERSVSQDQLVEDIRALNTGYAYFNGDFEVQTYKSDQPGNYVPETFNVSHKSYVNLSYWYEDDGEWNDLIGNTDVEYDRKVSYDQALEEVAAFKAAYNRYTWDELKVDPTIVLSDPNHDDDYENDDYYWGRNNRYISWEVENKVEKIWRLKFGESYFYMSIFSYEFMQVLFGIIGYLVLLTWMFKNVHWKNYMAAGITVLITPMLMGLTGLVIYEVVDISYSIQEEVILGLLITCNVMLILFSLIPLMSKRYSSMGVVCTILLQFWMPALIMIYAMLGIEIWRGDYTYSYNYDWDYVHEVRMWITEITYYGGWIFMLATIPLFKKYYAYMWAFPKSK